jgi:hypothetical protein
MKNMMRQLIDTPQKKKIAALRMYYLGGYSGYFKAQVRKILADGCSLSDLYASCVDDTMREWVRSAAQDNSINRPEK